MREEEPNWFSRTEEDLPTPEELMPLTQSLITPDLAMAFDIPASPTSPSATSAGRHHHLHLHPQQPSTPPPLHSPLCLHQDDHTPSTLHPQLLQADFELPELRSGAAGGDEPARTLKRPRLVWTPQLHKRFVDAVAHLGIKNAVPKTIMQLMNVDGLTRENVASHLQKYRLYLKRMQGGLPSGAAACDAATDRLFASSPVPHHFLSQGSSDCFLPFVPVTALQHHQRVAASVHPQQQQYYQHGHVGRIGPSPGGGFPNGYLTKQQQPGIQRVVGSGGTYAEDLESDAATEGEGGERRVLTLFPTGKD